MPATNPSDTPALGARVTNRRGGDLPGLAATLRVAELPNQRNGQLVLVYDSEGSGYYLHPSLTHEGRWCLGSRTVAFAADPAGQAAPNTGSSAARGAAGAVTGGNTPASGTRPQDGPELHVGTEHQGLSGVWVVCSCGLSTSKVTPRQARVAWNEQTEHALAALRSAVQTATTWLPNNTDPAPTDDTLFVPALAATVSGSSPDTPRVSEHSLPRLYDRVADASGGDLLPYVVTWVGADDPVDRRQVTYDTAQAADLTSSARDFATLTWYPAKGGDHPRTAGWRLGGVSGKLVVFTPLV